MLGMETIRKIRLALSKGMGIREAARTFNKARKTIRRIARSEETSFIYRRKEQRYPALGEYRGALEALLEAQGALPPSKRRTVLSLYEELQGQGYQGSYSSVRRYAGKGKGASGTLSEVYIPLVFGQGEAFQFDWSSEEVEVGGEVLRAGVAHFRLCHSRMSFLVAYPLQRMEMVLDAHVQAHNFWGGLCRRGIYDNLKSVETKIGKGKEREFNARFLECISHCLFEIEACTPAAGWEKGQVERQVQSMRKHIFTPRLCFSSFDELNAHLRSCVIAYAKTTPHPEMREKSIYDVFEEEQSLLVKTTLPFDACMAQEVRVSPQCLVTFDRNRYSVPCTYANKSVQRRVYANHIRFYADGRLIAEHPRVFGRDKTLCDPLHYLPVLERKPGALRNGRPFREWKLASGLQSLREALEGVKGGDKQLAGVLSAIPQYGEEAVSVACELALEAGLTSKDAVLNILCRTTEDAPARDIAPPGHLRLSHPPRANCVGYECLLEVTHDA
jgi:transposase